VGGGFFPQDVKGKKTTPHQPLLAIIKGAAVSSFSLTFKLPVLSHRGLLQIWRLFNE